MKGGHMADDDPQNRWSEQESEQFVQFSDIVFPHRAEQNAILTSVIPARTDEEFVAVDLGCGEGPLSRAILQRYPRSRVIGLDGSPLMLQRATAALSIFGGRFEARPFDLFRHDWLGALPDHVRCFVSSLAIHHLNSEQKRRLYHGLASRLEPGGALLIQDLIEPTSRAAWELNARMWNAYVKEASVRLTGSLEVYDTFVDDGWNHFATPDVGFDMPSGLAEQLQWFAEAGLTGADCFWFWYGHAIFGAFKPAN